jgi:hypothetical protein
VGARAGLNLDCAAAGPSDADSMKGGNCHQLNCFPVRASKHAKAHLEPDLRHETEDQHDRSGETNEVRTHLDFSSAQPNRPADFLAHGSRWKAGLREEVRWLVKAPPQPEVVPTWARSAWSTADWWGVVSVRVLFFFAGGGGSGDGVPSLCFSLTCRVFSAPSAPLGLTSISVSATFPIP